MTIPKKMSDRHRQIMGALLDEGLKQKELCARFDISQSQLSQIMNSPLWRYEMDKLREDRLAVDRDIAGVARRASIEYLVDVVDSEDEKTSDRISCAKTVLSRTGMGEGIVVEATVVEDSKVLHLTLADIRKEKEEIRKELGGVVDAGVLETHEAEIL